MKVQLGGYLTHDKDEVIWRLSADEAEKLADWLVARKGHEALETGHDLFVQARSARRYPTPEAELVA